MKYQIVEVKVDPLLGWGNDPYIEVFYTGNVPYDYNCYDEVNGHYVCVMPDGRVHHIYKRDPAVPDDGFGGSSRTVTMRDGSVRTWRGGWDTPLPIDSPLTPYVSIVWIDAARTYSRRSGRLTLERATELLEQFAPEWELYYRSMGWWTVKRKGEEPKNS